MKMKHILLLIAILLTVIVGVSAVQAEPQTGNCPHCNQTVSAETWKPWTFTDGEADSGHYYLPKSFSDQTGTITIPEGKSVCLDLRGQVYNTQNIRPFEVIGDFSIVDTESGGEFITTGANNVNGGFAVIRSTGVFALHSGTIRRSFRNDVSMHQGGLVYIDQGTMKITGGTITGGVVKTNDTVNAQGGNIFMRGGLLEISGGTISNGFSLTSGSARAQGGNIFIGNNGSVTISNGTVSNGFSDEDGGNIFLSGKTLTVTGGDILDGHAVRQGGNISQANESAEIATYLHGGTLKGGVAGGKLNSDDTKCGSGGGGNYYAYNANGTLSVSNCVIGGDMKIDAIKSVTLSGNTKIGLGKSNGLFLPGSVTMDVSGLTDGSEIFVHASNVFTKPVSSADAARIHGYFKGAVRTGITLDTSNYTLVAAQGNTGYCPHCYDPNTPQAVTWYDIGFAPTAGKLHCYLTKSDTATGNRTVAQDIVLDLNGYTFCRNTNRIIMYAAGKSFTILDSFGGGKVKGGGTDSAQNANGAVIQFAYKSNVILLSGTMTMDPGTGTSAVPKGGVINANVSGSTFTMNGGIVSGGSVIGDGGGNIYMNTGTTFTMNAGIVKNGAASGKSGGNVYCAGTAQILGGFIINGSAGNGGNLYVTGSMDMSGGTIAGGIAATSGGNIYAPGTSSSLDISGGIIRSGNAASAGNVYIEGNLSVTGGEIVDGAATANGGNMFIGGAALNMTGGAIASGSAAKGGNIYSSATKSNLQIHGGKITSGQATDGGNIHLNNGILSVNNNALIIAGHATYGGNLRIGASASAGSATATLSGGAIKDGAAQSGGNVYSLQTTNLCGATVLNGYAEIGGNITVAGGTTTISDGLICNGQTTDRGGNIYQSNPGAFLNQTGGNVTGGYAKSAGGNIYIANGAFTISGGTISNGTSFTGGNIYLGFFNNATATIGGTGNPVISGGYAFGGVGGNIVIRDEANQAEDDDYIPHPTKPWVELDKCVIRDGVACTFGDNIFVYMNARMRVLESFDGSASVFFHYDLLPDGTPYGGLLDTKLVTASGEFSGTLILENFSDKPYAFHDNGNLRITPAALVKNGIFTWYRSNDELVANYANADYMRPVAGNLELTGGTYTIDLAGQDIQITGSGIIYGLDSANVTYEQFGSVTVGEGIKLGGAKTCIDDKTYIALQAENTFTFHRAGLDITDVTLRPSAAGLYFSALWQCDEVLAEKIDKFGVVVSLAGAPEDDFVAKKESLYTIQTGFENKATGNGVLINGILNTKSADKNSAYAKTPIYAAAYINIDGNYYTGITQSQSLHSLLELLNNNIYDYYDHAASLQSFMDEWRNYGLTGADWNLEYNVPVEIAMLRKAYQGTQAYHGEFHDHADTGGNSDGNYTLAQWMDGLQLLDMDFATILDHRQDLHMHLEDWDEAYFIGGTEIGATITDLEDATRSWLHMNMVFASWQDLRNAIAEFDAIAPGGGFRHYEGENGEWYMTNLQYFSDLRIDCRITKAQLAQLISIVRKNNGIFVAPHPKESDCVVSDNIEDYWYSDWSGLEVIYTYHGTRAVSDYIQANYKLWTQLLAAGKKIWATAGNDEHAMATDKAITTIYATDHNAQAYMKQAVKGNMTAGPVGIRMAVGDGNEATVMGSECDFNGKNLVFSVDDFHSSIKGLYDSYKVVLIADEQIVQQWQMTDDGNLYHYQIADATVNYYRIEVYDGDGVLLALGNPIWNTAVQ